MKDETEQYAIVTTRLRRVADLSITVDRPASLGAGTCPVPRSLIHGADDRKMDSAFIGGEVTFRLMAWKAEALGFA